VPKSAKYLLVGSPEAYCGKSAIILGMAHLFQKKGLNIVYGKPLGTCLTNSQPKAVDEDVLFIAETLQLSNDRLLPTLIPLDEATISQQLAGSDQTDYLQMLRDYTKAPTGDLVLLEGAGTLEEGRLFGLALPQMAEELDAAVVLVTRYRSGLVVESLLAAKQQLGNRLVGVLINDILIEHLEMVNTQIKPFLEKRNIAVLGMLPRNDLLRSVSVSELAHQLKAEVLCRSDRLDLMVESLKIGAMSVNSALGYFRKGHNMAVITGGDRTDIQLAALETSTHCLILTGQIPPSAAVLGRAEDLEIPILSVDLDTLTTVEIVDRTFGQVRLHEPVKVQAVCQMMTKYFDIDRLLTKLELEPVVTA
jgi:uncharacterized protein